MTFSEVIGQDEAKERLMQMVSEDRLPHAMMLCGPVGSGKLVLAIAFGCHLLNPHHSDNTQEPPMLQKQDLGAQYAVTQLFFDNEKYFKFVEQARQMGITIPIIPGIKPMAKLSQLTVVPKTFHCDIPEPLAREIVKCKTDEDAKALGIEWTTQQCCELYQHGVHNIHFYTVSAVDSVAEVAKRLL